MSSRERSLEIIEKELQNLQEKYDVSFDELVSELKTRQEERQNIPISIFNNEKLSALEAVVKYLKENKAMSYSQIASILSRNYDPIAITYRKSKKKMAERLKADPSKTMPAKVLQNKQLSVLENITSYLKEDQNLTYSQIALILRRDDRTIWTVYQRSLKKRR